MNRRIKSHEITVDQNSPVTELRLKLSTLGFKFLTVTVIDGTIAATFEEQDSDKSCNESFFVFNGDQAIRCPERYEYLTSFTADGQVFHFFGYRTNR